MSEQLQETVQERDLSDVLAHAPLDVVELLGEEEVARVERLYQLVLGLVELSKLPDPFKEPRDKTGWIITPEVKATVEEINATDLKALDAGDPQISVTARRNAPILKAAIRSGRSRIADNYNSNNKLTIALEDQVSVIDPKDISGTAAQMPGIYEAMAAIAADLVPPEAAKELLDLVKAEMRAMWQDEKTSGLQRRPEFKEVLQRIWAEGKHARTRHNDALSHQKLDEHTKLSIKVENIGRKSWRVRRAHRSRIDMIRDEEFADKASEKIKSLRTRGSALHRLMTEKTLDAAHGPSLNLLSAVFVLREKFYEGYLESRGLEDVLADDSTKATGLAAEAYIIDRAKQAEHMIRQAGVKLSREGRKAVHESKETRVERVARRLADMAIEAEANPFDEIEPSDSFRVLCRDARDILVGGGRIDHPIAHRLAEDLRKLRLGADRNGALEPAERGFVVGIVTGKINSLMCVVERLERAAYAEDVQLAKLGYDLPEQYAILSGFDLDVTLERLKTILDSGGDVDALLGLLLDEATAARVRSTIESLWRERQGLDHQENLDEVSAEDEEPQMTAGEEELGDSVYEPGSEELELIDAEMTEIAEQLEWVVFPSGTTLSDIQRTLGENQVDLSRVNWERIEHLLYLANNFEGKIYRSSEAKLGTSVPYLVAEIKAHGHRFAIAECPEIGNATYIVDDMSAAGPWEDVMRLSKAEARSVGARRIIHPKEEGHLNKIVRRINSMLTIKAA